MSFQDILDDPDKVKLITKAVFTSLDTKKAGFLDRNDIEGVFINIAKDISIKRPTKEEIDDLVREYNVKKDGKITMDEFEGLVTELLKQMSESLEDN